jgi:uncharacterized protein with von Willebrand factor type A (vWA) domain
MRNVERRPQGAAMLFDPPEQLDNAQAPSSAPAAPAAPSAAQAEPTELNATVLEQEGTSGTELETQPPEPEDADFEYEGKKFKVPKDIEGELRNALLRHGDYTRKTQEVADQRKAIEADRTAHQQQVQVHQALTKEIGQITAVDERLQQLQQVNWNALIAENPQQAQILQSEFTRLQTLRGQLGNSITQKQQQMQFTQQQEIAKRVNEAQAFLMREFKDWSPAKDQALSDYAKKEGLDPRQLSQFLLYSPQLARVLDKAARFDQSEKQRAAKPPAAPAPKPISRVGGSAASNTKLPSQMTPEEHAVWRQERKSKRR